MIVNLLENQTANISQATLELLVEQSKGVDAFQDPLLTREELREDLAKKMFIWVSATLRSHIVERYELSKEMIDELLEEVAREEIDNTIAHRQSSDSKLKTTLKNEGLVIPSMVVAALMDGEAALFLSLFSTLTNLNESLARRIIFEEGGEAMAIACKALDVPEMQVGLIYERTRKAIRAKASAREAEKRRHAETHQQGRRRQDGPGAFSQ